VMEAVKQFGGALEHASAELKGDREIVMEAVKHGRISNAHALMYASPELQGDREIVMAAVKQLGTALSCASAGLKGDREIVMEAVKQNWQALQYASTTLKGDLEIVTEAVALAGFFSNALVFAAPALRNGGLKDHLDSLKKNVFNVPAQNFIATLLFGAKDSSSSSEADESGSASSRPRLCDNSGCVLSLLRPSTVLPKSLSTQIKRLIWAYAGVRSGRQWKVIDTAARNIKFLAFDGNL
jgi:hypothetical protein